MNSFLRLNQLWQLTSALFREIIREPGVLFWGILFPILMSLGLGLAFTKKADMVRKIAVSWPSGIPETGNSDLYRFLEMECIKQQSESNKDFTWQYEMEDD
jgi:hypothetical protein